MTSEQWWLATKWARQAASVAVDAMRQVYGVPFAFTPIDRVQRALHELDRDNVGRVVVRFLDNDDALTDYRVRQLVEESISSSEIEGARPTTRELARQMVREQREPVSKDERMILNNWRAMQHIIERRRDPAPLTLDELCELHRTIGEDALDVADAAGKLRTTDDDVSVADMEGNVWHRPPVAYDDTGTLPPIHARVEALLRFVEGGDGGTFIHPIIRAIVSHFWMGYEHPFRDGNGRVARALYYWVMLRQGYEMADFLSISGPIDRRPNAYVKAFTHVEIDDGDLTYFVLHQLDVLEEALDELTQHLTARAKHIERMSAMIAGFDQLNHRQRALLEHAARHPLQSYTIEGHARSHRVHYQTARSDLVRLEKLGFVEGKRVQKKKRFFAGPKLKPAIAKRHERGPKS